jgi:hypothetical protein
MNPPRLTRPPWTCECGRKVPAHVEACRCGKGRPEDTGPGGAAEWAEKQATAQTPQAEASGLFSTKSLLQVGGLILVVGLFFGSRYFNRYRASREVRTAVISALSKEVGEEVATGIVDKVHWGCFEPNYHMSFKRRGGAATFDDENYATCVRRAIEREAGEIRSASQKSALAEQRAAREAKRQEDATARSAASTSAPPVNPATASPTPSAPRVVAVSGLTVQSFDRSSSTLRASFLVIGADASRFMCQYTLICGSDRKVLSDGLLSCVKPRDTVRADGELHFTLSKPAPEGACTFNLVLTDGALGSSNRVTVAIP